MTAITNPQVHYFDSTHEGYDLCQCSEVIKDGDVLVVESEGVVGVLLGAWPTAATIEHGDFHKFSEGYDGHTIDDGKYAESFDRAIYEMRKLRKLRDTVT